MCNNSVSYTRQGLFDEHNALTASIHSVINIISILQHSFNFDFDCFLHQNISTCSLMYHGIGQQAELLGVVYLQQ